MTCFIYFNEPLGPFKCERVHEECYLNWKIFKSYCIQCKKKLKLKKQFEIKSFWNGKLFSYDKHNKRNSECKMYHENGNIRYHCFYKDGILHGEFKSYYRNGDLWDHCYYENDEPIKVFKNGKVVWIKQIK
jgi:hypothetical protein